MFQISVRLLDMRLLLRNYPCKLIPLFLLLDGLMVCQVHLLIIILGLNDMHRVLLMNEVLWRRVYCIQLSKLLLNLRNEFGVDLVNDNDDSRF